MSFTQLTLDFGLRDDATFTNYCAIQNEQPVHCLQQMALANGEQYVYLWGQAQVGKTHLLQAACNTANLNKISAIYLPCADLKSLDPKMLSGLEQLDLVCIDDLDQLLPNSVWEEAIFYLFNKLKAKQHRLLITANLSANQLSVNLPDLKSRLLWGVVYQLQPLSDQGKLQILQMHAKQRGLELDDQLGWFLLRRYARSTTALLQALAKLDQASLQQQRKLTVPFVKQVLDI